MITHLISILPTWFRTSSVVHLGQRCSHYVVLKAFIISKSHYRLADIAGRKHQQINIASAYFQMILGPESTINNLINYTLKEMSQPFKNEEISKAEKMLNNGRNPGPDKLKQELIKHEPIIINHENNKNIQ